MILPVLCLAVVGFVIGFPMTALLVRMGRRLGALDAPGAAGHVKRLRPVPNIGGVAIWSAVAAPLALGIAVLALVDREALVRAVPDIALHLDRLRQGEAGARSSLAVACALLAGMTVLHVVGLVDDRRGLSAWPKLVIEIAVALVLAIWFDVRLLELLGPVPSVVITVLWIVAVTNAINFMDNMDGLAGGVAAIAAALFACATVVNGQWFIAAILALLVGALAGFLAHNVAPAKIFMGDGGSLVVGFLLAVLTARTTFVAPSDGQYALGTAWYGVLMPIVVLAIPLYDLVVVTVRRLARGRSPFVGDQAHFSHRLVERGLTERAAVAVIWGATAVTGIGGVFLGRLAPWQAALVGVQTLLVLGLIALLEHATRHRAQGSPP